LGLGSSNFEPELQAKYPDIRAQVLGLQIPMLQLILVCRQRYSNYDSADDGSEFIEADQEDSSLYIVFLLRIGTEEVYHLFAKRMMLL
jgi:hypothetical protein